MDVKTVNIDAGRGVAHVYGEEKRLAESYEKGDGWNWFVYADIIRPDVRYDVIAENRRGEVVGVFFGYYKPNMIAIEVYPVWSPPGMRYRRVKVARRIFKARPVNK